MATDAVLFIAGLRDSSNIRFLYRLHKIDSSYRYIVLENQKVQGIVFCCQLFYSACLQPLLDWCWAPLHWWWNGILNLYISCVFEIVLFLFVGWKALHVNQKFAKLTTYQKTKTKTNTKSKTNQIVQERTLSNLHSQDTFERIGLLWNSMVLSVSMAMFELIKMFMYGLFTRMCLLLSGRHWMLQIIGISCISFLQTIQIFDQGFASLPTVILSRLYDHYKWYFIGFGMWIAMFFFWIPIPFHFKVILLYATYPWHLALALNASIKPDVSHLSSMKKQKRPFGIETFLQSSYACFNRFSHLLQEYKIIAWTSKLFGFNAYYWKPILYSCALATLASGLVRLLLLIGSFVVVVNKR